PFSHSGGWYRFPVLGCRFPSSLPPWLDRLSPPRAGSSAFRPPHKSPARATNKEGHSPRPFRPEPGTDCGNRYTPQGRYGGPWGFFFIVLRQPSKERIMSSSVLSTVAIQDLRKTFDQLGIKTPKIA